MQTQQMTKAYDIYVEIKAEKTGQTPAEIQSAFPPDVFEQTLLGLHERWTSGEFSFGRFTELMGVPHLELWEILEALDLPAYD